MQCVTIPRIPWRMWVLEEAGRVTITRLRRLRRGRPGYITTGSAWAVIKWPIWTFDSFLAGFQGAGISIEGEESKVYTKMLGKRGCELPRKEAKKDIFTWWCRISQFNCFKCPWNSITKMSLKMLWSYMVGKGDMKSLSHIPEHVIVQNGWKKEENMRRCRPQWISCGGENMISSFQLQHLIPQFFHYLLPDRNVTFRLFALSIFEFCTRYCSARTHARAAYWSTSAKRNLFLLSRKETTQIKIN